METPDAVAARIRHLEERLVLAEVRQSREELTTLLADDFREFGSSGEIYDKPRILAALGAAPSLTIELEDFRASVLSPSIVLATYVAVTRRAGRETDSRSLRSSLWRSSGDRWQVVFHQGTRCAAVPE